MKKRAFTLSEVLLVLSVIGVVAALTIPTLVGKISDDQTSSAAKKQYSVLSQAVNRLVATDGLWDSLDGNTMAINMRNSFSKYLSFIKDDIAANIFASKYYFYKNTALSGNMMTSTNPSVVLSDGSAWLFASTQNCSGGDGPGLTGVCGYVYVDVNGTKPPNMFGKDWIAFWIIKQASSGAIFVAPLGSNGDQRTCVANAPTQFASDGCSALVVTGQPMP